MDEMSGGNCSLNNRTLPQQYCYYNNGDVSSVYDFLNNHTIYQCEDSSKLKKIDDDVEKGDGDAISGYGFKQPQYLPTC